MRVTVLSASPGIPLYGPSGASAHLRGIIEALSAEGHRVEVAVLSEQDHRGHFGAVRTSAVQLPPRRSTWRSRSLREWTDARALVGRLQPPDVLWERQSLFCDAGIRAVRQWRRAGHRVRHLLEVNAPHAEERERYETLGNASLARWFESRTHRRADVAACVSSHLTERLRARGAHAVHLPNGTSLTTPGRREILRARLGIEGPIMGFVGSMKPWHGVERIVAFLDRLPDWHAVVAGDGEAPEHPRLHALGHLDGTALADAISGFDVALAPYRTDAPPWFSPLKVFDYRAQGIPIVGAALGDIPDLLADGSGETVDTDDPSAWVHAIVRQVDRPRIRRVRSWNRVVCEGLDALEERSG